MQEMPQFGDMPEAIRTIMKSSIEQAKKAFNTFIGTSEKMMHSFDSSASVSSESLKALNDKIAQFTRENAEANFTLALRLADARQLSDVVEMQNAHVRAQMEAYSRQMEELRELTTQVVKESARQTSTAMQETMNKMPVNPATFNG
jgi:phasin